MRTGVSGTISENLNLDAHSTGGTFNFNGKTLLLYLSRGLSIFKSLPRLPPVPSAF